MPYALRRMLLQLVLESEAAQDPRDALRALLTLDADVYRCINRAALRYGNGVHVKHRLMNYHDFFVARVQSGDRVLDIGCGYGAVAYSLASRSGATVVGIDINSTDIAQARERYQHPRLKFIEGDALTSIPEEPFDAIVLSNVLEHIQHRTEFLMNLQRKHSPKRWLIRVPMFNRDWRVALRKELGLFYFSDRTHYTEYTQQSFEAELATAGLLLQYLQVNWGEIWAEAISPSVRSY